VNLPVPEKAYLKLQIVMEFLDHGIYFAPHRHVGVCSLYSKSLERVKGRKIK
jgi:hypothetical protein